MMPGMILKKKDLNITELEKQELSNSFLTNVANYLERIYF